MKINRREESPISAPRSLFDHPNNALQKVRREVKLHKYRGLARPASNYSMAPVPGRMAPPQRDDNSPEWSVHEDWALLQALETLQDLPLNLTSLKAGHTPNWDLVTDMVNQVSCTTRSPNQCRTRLVFYG